MSVPHHHILDRDRTRETRAWGFGGRARQACVGGSGSAESSHNVELIYSLLNMDYVRSAPSWAMIHEWELSVSSLLSALLLTCAPPPTGS